MPESTIPPPKTGGNGAFIGAAVVMLLLMGGLIYWKMRGGEDDTKPPPAEPVAKVEAPPVVEEAVPPPPPEEEDAGPSSAPKSTVKRGAVPTGGGGCDSTCTGSAPGALQAALRSKAGQARGCYERALRQNATLEGRLVLNVRVGGRGQVCSASVSSDELGDTGTSQCVLQLFRAASLPAPAGGCVDTAVPMNFRPKS